MKSPPPIVYILVGLALLGAGWATFRSGSLTLPFLASQDTQVTDSPSFAPTRSAPPQVLGSAGADAYASLDFTEPDPRVVEMDGSVTMVRMVKMWQNAYAQRYPNTPTTYGVPDGNPNGSSRGLEGLREGRLHLAASSRPLRPEEVQADLVAVPVARDAVAVVVGVENPFQGELTLEQVAAIFKGRITNWADVGGPNQPIRVLNRSLDSGTRELFQNIVLLGQDFAPDGPNFITFERDVTTPILRALNRDGIGYTTVSQAENQLTVRIVPIEGLSPTDRGAVQRGEYLISRSVFLVAPRQTSTAVKRFIDLTLSEQGQRLAEQADFIPLGDASS